MVANNGMYKTHLKLQDFDARSLYPSAMSRLYTVEGTPEVFKFIDKATGSDNHEMIDNKLFINQFQNSYQTKQHTWLKSKLLK